jgi:hypothetical protein
MITAGLVLQGARDVGTGHYMGRRRTPAKVGLIRIVASGSDGHSRPGSTRREPFFNTSAP